MTFTIVNHGDHFELRIEDREFGKSYSLAFRTETAAEAVSIILEAKLLYIESGAL